MERLKKTGLIFSLLIAVSLMAMPVMSYAEQKGSDKVLAKVGKEKITEADIFSKISMLPPQFRARYETPEGKKKLLDQTVKFSLLSQEARSLGAVATGGSQSPLDLSTLECDELLIEPTPETLPISRQIPHKSRREMAYPDDPLPRPDGRLQDLSFQLANVARPVVCLEEGERLVRDGEWPEAGLRR